MSKGLQDYYNTIGGYSSNADAMNNFISNYDDSFYSDFQTKVNEVKEQGQALVEAGGATEGVYLGFKGIQKGVRSWRSKYGKKNDGDENGQGDDSNGGDVDSTNAGGEVGGELDEFGLPSVESLTARLDRLMNPATRVGEPPEIPTETEGLQGGGSRVGPGDEDFGQGEVDRGGTYSTTGGSGSEGQRADSGDIEAPAERSEVTNPSFDPDQLDGLEDIGFTEGDAAGLFPAPPAAPDPAGGGAPPAAPDPAGGGAPPAAPAAPEATEAGLEIPDPASFTSIVPPTAAPLPPGVTPSSVAPAAPAAPPVAAPDPTPPAPSRLQQARDQFNQNDPSAAPDGDAPNPLTTDPLTAAPDPANVASGLAGEDSLITPVVEGGEAAVGFLTSTFGEAGVAAAGIALEAVPVLGGVAAIGFGLYELFHHTSTPKPPPPPLTSGSSKGQVVTPSFDSVTDTPASAAAF